MFIINLNYIVPLETLHALMTEHMKYLQKYYKLNVFVASGCKVPRMGGIILALAKSKEEAEEITLKIPYTPTSWQKKGEDSKIMAGTVNRYPLIAKTFARAWLLFLLVVSHG